MGQTAFSEPESAPQPSGEFVQYEHHGQQVWVRKAVKGEHRSLCLCYDCEKFKPGEGEANCPIAEAVYQNCVKFNLVTPVLECPAFVEASRERRAANRGQTELQLPIVGLARMRPLDAVKRSPCCCDPDQ